MLADLEHLIHLQQLENTAIEARDKIEALPERLNALEAHIAERESTVTNATKGLDEHKTARAALEKDVAEVQGRLNRFKEQLMAVKTNKEYHAMQTEIANAERGLQRLEDRLLEQMLEADVLSGDVRQAEQLLAEERESAGVERRELEQERAALEEKLTALDDERARTADQLAAPTKDLFETLARGRKGVAVVEARDGRCTSCQVRLRPQLFNDVRSNSALIQCESCQRILYFAEHRHVAG